MTLTNAAGKDQTSPHGPCQRTPALDPPTLPIHVRGRSTKSTSGICALSPCLTRARIRTDLRYAAPQFGERPERAFCEWRACTDRRRWEGLQRFDSQGVFAAGRSLDAGSGPIVQTTTTRDEPRRRMPDSSRS